GRAYHIVDRAAPLAQEVFETLSALLGRPPPRGQLPYSMARALLQFPGVGRLAHAQQALLEELSRDARVDDTHARAVLIRAGLDAPPCLAHPPKLVEFVSHQTRRAWQPLTLTRPAS